MATDNRGVMVYLPPEVELKMQEYCTQYNITRKDKQGNLVTSLGSGIVAYLKSQLLGDTLRIISDTPNPGLTRQEVLDLIAESSTSNTPIEQKLSSSTGISRDEVEQLIQVSEQKIMEATRSLLLERRVELAEITTIDEQVNTSDLALSTTSHEKAMENTVKPPAIDSTIFSNIRKLIAEDLRVHLDPLESDERFREIIHSGISKGLSNRTIATRLFELGYGKEDKKNTKPYSPTTIDSIKKVWECLLETYKKQKAEDTFKSPALDPMNSATFDR